VCESWQENQLVSGRRKFLRENADAVALNVPAGPQFQVVCLGFSVSALLTRL